jgi:hypothetical protein
MYIFIFIPYNIVLDQLVTGIKMEAPVCKLVENVCRDDSGINPETGNVSTTMATTITNATAPVARGINENGISSAVNISRLLPTIDRLGSHNIDATIQNEIENNNNNNRNATATATTTIDDSNRAIAITNRNNNSNSVNGAVWQNDNEAKVCLECGIKFTFFNRKHHCRKCGKIFCNSCCGKYCTFIPGSLVIEPEEAGGNRIINEAYKYFEFRTCNKCYEELLMLKEALGIVVDMEDLDDEYVEEEEEAIGSIEDNGISLHGQPRNRSRRRRLRRRGMIRETSEGTETNTDGDIDDISVVKHSQPREITMELSDSTRANINASSTDDLNQCPICGINIQSITDSEREEHINKCIQDQEFGSPLAAGGTMKRDKNRMLVYVISADADPNALAINEDNECVICLDEFHPGDKVGRLECLCCFHYSCISDWVRKKGYCECPVHSLHQT